MSIIQIVNGYDGHKTYGDECVTMLVEQFETLVRWKGYLSKRECKCIAEGLRELADQFDDDA